MRIIIYTKKRSEMQNRNYQRNTVRFEQQPVKKITVEEANTATELLNNALNNTPLPVLTRSSSIMPEPVLVFNVEHKITHDKPFNEIWGFAQDIMRTIPNAVKYNVVATDMNYNSGRQKFVCSFYNKNHDLLERHLAMSLFSKKTNKQYYSVMIEAMRE